MPNMISKELNDEMNKQIVEELRSGYIYLGMAAWAEAHGLHNLADFMKTHAEKEEYKHAMKFVKFIQEAGGTVKYGTIDEVSVDYDNAKELVEAAIKHEQHISERIRYLTEIAQKNRDYYAMSLLTWFNDEQLEEENLFEELLNQYELNGGRVGLWDHHIHHP